MYYRVVHTREASRKFSVIRSDVESLSEMHERIEGKTFLFCEVAMLSHERGNGVTEIVSLVPSLMRISTISEIQPYIGQVALIGERH